MLNEATVRLCIVLPCGQPRLWAVRSPPAHTAIPLRPTQICADLSGNSAGQSVSGTATKWWRPSVNGSLADPAEMKYSTPSGVTAAAGMVPCHTPGGPSVIDTVLNASAPFVRYEIVGASDDPATNAFTAMSV